MQQALLLAKKGAGWVNPNPMVGAVLVREEKIVGEGFHEHFGAPHAEVNAIRDFYKRYVSAEGSLDELPLEAQMQQMAGALHGLLDDATLYVTLEPCSHQGKTPPCAPFLVQCGIPRVVVGMVDPNPLVNGNGIAYLRSQGVEVEPGVAAEEARAMNEVFVKYVTTGLPFAVLKTAMTLDGKIATVTNASRWITGIESRRAVHHMRHQYSAVMVGVNTVMFDDPQLNIRLRKSRIGVPWKAPLKVIADSHGRIPLQARIFARDPQLTVVAVTSLAPAPRLREIERLGAQVMVCPIVDNRVDLNFLMKSLGIMGIDSVMIEGGSTLAFSALKEGVVDKIITFVAPKILGGKNAPSPVGGEGIERMEEALDLTGMKVKKIGADLMIEAWLRGMKKYNQ
jgi:diaminohydroxyphosphoribosylaminopyrimidine deaminase/5-amino-6-(5-phosphoribosylamino)uracil reductase